MLYPYIFSKIVALNLIILRFKFQVSLNHIVEHQAYGSSSSSGDFDSNTLEE